MQLDGGWCDSRAETDCPTCCSLPLVCCLPPAVSVWLYPRPPPPPLCPSLDLRKHSEIVHEKRRPFACGECGWRAGKKEHLKRHVRLIHERRRPFMCTVCSVSFGTKQNYQEHTKTLAHRRTMMAGGEPSGMGYTSPAGMVAAAMGGAAAAGGVGAFGGAAAAAAAGGVLGGVGGGVGSGGGGMGGGGGWALGLSAPAGSALVAGPPAPALGADLGWAPFVSS